MRNISPIRCSLLFLSLLAVILFRFCACGHFDRFHASENDFVNVSITDRHGKVPEHSVRLFSVNFSHVQFPIILCMSLFLLGVAKLGFQHANYLSSIFPESCLLIVVGIFLSLLVHWTGAQNDFVFKPRVFFLYLLPPIMLEAAFCLHNRAVWENLGTILVFACLGTVLNTFITAPILFLFNDAGAFGVLAQFDFPHCLLFAAIISAVDPVAVLAIFEEIHVNSALYFIVFGESLLNDAMTVVLYRMMEVFVVLPTIPVSEMAKGVCSFFIVSLGGVLFGVVFGVCTSILTRFTKHARVVEPLIIFTGAYFSYLLAECFEFSGIISIICCGIVMAQYAFANISRKSHTVVVCCSKLLSSTCDCVIFLFLGMEFTEFVSGLVTGSEKVNLSFVICSLMLCVISRFAIVTSFSYLLNLFRVRKITKQEQFIMGYGGLRGAVCFSLVKLLDPAIVQEKGTLMTATLCIIFFTVFVQGITMKPIVRALKIKMNEEKRPTMNEAINSNLIDHIMTGIEEVVGHLGDHRFKDTFDRLDEKYLRRFLQREPLSVDDKLMNLYADIMMREHRAHIQACRKIRLISASSAPYTAPAHIEGFSTPADRIASTPLTETNRSNWKRFEGNASKDHHMDRKADVESKNGGEDTQEADSITPQNPRHLMALVTRLKRAQTTSRKNNRPLRYSPSGFEDDEVFETSRMLQSEKNNHARRQIQLRECSMEKGQFDDIMQDVYLRRRRAETVHLGGSRRGAKGSKSNSPSKHQSPLAGHHKHKSEGCEESGEDKPHLKRCGAMNELDIVAPGEQNVSDELRNQEGKQAKRAKFNLDFEMSPVSGEDGNSSMNFYERQNTYKL